TAGLIGEVIFIVIEHVTGFTPKIQLGFVIIPPQLLGYLLLGLTLAATVVKYYHLRLDYDMRYYVITDRSLRIREGVLIVAESTFTYANVQNLRIEQGPLERLLGISNLVVDTAGGAGASSDEKSGSHFGRPHQGVLRGVANATAVRDQMLALLKRYRDAGLGDPEDRLREPATSARRFSPAMVERLREIRDEFRAWRNAGGAGATDKTGAGTLREVQ
ncbi:MAG: PH domain-containing protein, partial [Planctomycetota bacterium]